MNIIQRIMEFEMRNHILENLNNGNLSSKNHIIVNKTKTELRKQCGIISINVTGSTNKDNRTVIAKTKNNTFIYDYDRNHKTLIVKGERKNAIS